MLATGKQRIKIEKMYRDAYYRGDTSSPINQKKNKEEIQVQLGLHTCTYKVTSTHMEHFGSWNGKGIFFLYMKDLLIDYYYIGEIQ